MPWTSLVAAAAAIVLPLTFTDGNVFVSARIRDQPLRLIVDTGGKGTLQLTAAASRRLGVELLPEVVTRTDALGNQYAGPAFEIAELQIADSNFQHVEGFVRGEAAGGVTGGLPADGLLGMEFLRPYIARFDYTSATLTLYSTSDPSDSGTSCRGADVPVVNHPLGFWSSEMKTDHGPIRVVWDTGATHSVISAEVARTRRLPLEDDLYRTKSLQTGSKNYGPLDLVAIELHVPETDALIGYNFFQTHVVCFDGPRSMLIVVD